MARQRELESRAAALKAAQTWHATRTIQMCREACGGAGYLRANRFAALKADTDVFTTFAPSMASRTAIASPMPRLAPVTSATFPSSGLSGAVI